MDVELIDHLGNKQIIELPYTEEEHLLSELENYVKTEYNLKGDDFFLTQEETTFKINITPQKLLQNKDVQPHVWIDYLWEKDNDIEIKKLILQCNPTLIYTETPKFPRRVYGGGVKPPGYYTKKRQAYIQKEIERCNTVHTIDYDRPSLLRKARRYKNTQMIDLIIEYLYKLETKEVADEYIRIAKTT